MAKAEREPITRQEAAEVVAGSNTPHLCNTPCTVEECDCLCRDHCACNHGLIPHSG